MSRRFIPLDDNFHPTPHYSRSSRRKKLSQSEVEKSRSEVDKSLWDTECTDDIESISGDESTDTGDSSESSSPPASPDRSIFEEMCPSKTAALEELSTQSEVEQATTSNSPATFTSPQAVDGPGTVSRRAKKTDRKVASIPFQPAGESQAEGSVITMKSHRDIVRDLKRSHARAYQRLYDENYKYRREMERCHLSYIRRQSRTQELLDLDHDGRYRRAVDDLAKLENEMFKSQALKGFDDVDTGGDAQEEEEWQGFPDGDKLDGVPA
ncbi:MAG: hypothetical protein M1828_002973 [Chrysothrix sp. TS-e1954]|nr:MAG: hypothetical protein M1828_002973 [Chrysothrix sp. TS-e1954]